MQGARPKDYNATYLIIQSDQCHTKTFQHMAQLQNVILKSNGTKTDEKYKRNGQPRPQDTGNLEIRL